MIDYDTIKRIIESALHDFMDSGIYSYLESPRLVITPKLYIDGSMWCALIGEDLQSGVAGFGDTPHKALMELQAEMHKAPEVKP